MTHARPVGLYLHIPFCRQRCHFCAFYLEIGRPERMDAFGSALAREIELYRRDDVLSGRPLESIYFGGGTPTALSAPELVSLLELMRTAWPTEPGLEVTVEAHPATVTGEDLRLLAGSGFNRISFGAESMKDEDFAPIGRPGSVEVTERAVADARSAGFTNINLDLMYGLPGQTLDSWLETVRSSLALNPSHISCYALTIEEGTKLAHETSRNPALKPDDGLLIDMETVAEPLLTEAGFIRYEISNYARPGAACRHNQLYWTGADYLGLGPSAQSYVDGVRFGNVADLTLYMDLLSKQALPLAERAVLTSSEQQRDALVFGLRLLRGVPLTVVDSPDQRDRVRQLVAQGLLESDSDRVRLTPLGQRYADSVAEELF